MKGIALKTGLIAISLASSMLLPVSAQVTSDGTTNTTVNSTGNNFNILNGIQKGNNLFHSFGEFSIPTGGSATFNNSTGVVNIINRVTGGNVSNIDGLLKAQGNANLFLVNPAGIVFGENARLDIGGSFLGTTAESILFEDGFEFNAVNPQNQPLLTVSVPVGLQMGSNPGKIEVNGSGHELTYNRANTSFTRDARPVGLQVPDGKTLALIGGDISLQGGNLTAQGGRIELGSVSESATVELIPTSDGFTFAYDGVDKFGDINLSQLASIEVSGEGSGNIQIQGRKISLQEDSVIIANTLGGKNGGLFSIKASESVEIIGNDFSTNSIFTGFFSGVEFPAAGNGGNINIEAPQLSISRFSQISASTSGDGDAGDINLKVNNLDMRDDISSIFLASSAEGDGGDLNINAADSVSLNDSTIATLALQGDTGNINIETPQLSLGSSSIINNTFGNGDAGDINLKIDNLAVEEGSSIATTAWGNADGGDLNIIAAESVVVAGFEIRSNGNIISSSLSSNAEIIATGNAGNLNISTPRLEILEGGEVSANTRGAGNAGNIIIRAEEIKIADPIVEFNRNVSGLLTNVSASSSGNGGSLDIEAKHLNIYNGGQINASTDGAGNAGTINIRADKIDIDGESSDGMFRSAITSASTTNFTAGSINLSGNQINIRDGASVSVNSSSGGSAGTLEINADSVDLSTQAQITASTFSGEGGNININLQESLILRRGSSIDTESLGSGNGGNITINSPVIASVENSDIIANAVEGNGGNIDITTQGIFGLEFREELTPDSDITASSQFGVNGTVEINNFGIDPSSGLVELPVALTDESQQIASGCSNNTGNTFVATGRGGIPQNPKEQVDTNLTWSDIRDLSAYRQGNNH
ncbi:MAG: S-layer family protein, partial [Cyanobacteria bacterium P01_A01_bin.68]